jgi:hypothetical protein
MAVDDLPLRPIGGQLKHGFGYYDEVSILSQFEASESPRAVSGGLRVCLPDFPLEFRFGPHQFPLCQNQCFCGPLSFGEILQWLTQHEVRTFALSIHLERPDATEQQMCPAEFLTSGLSHLEGFDLALPYTEVGNDAALKMCECPFGEALCDRGEVRDLVGEFGPK